MVKRFAPSLTPASMHTTHSELPGPSRGLGAEGVRGVWGVRGVLGVSGGVSCCCRGPFGKAGPASGSSLSFFGESD